MAKTYKVLGQLEPTAASLSTLYTVPGVTSAICSTLTICNMSSIATSFRIAIRPAGAAINNKHYIAYDCPIDGNETKTFTIGLSLSTTDVVSVYATLATLTFSLFGCELT